MIIGFEIGNLIIFSLYTSFPINNHKVLTFVFLYLTKRKKKKKTTKNKNKTKRKVIPSHQRTLP